MSQVKDDDLWEDPYYGKTQWEDALIKVGCCGDAVFRVLRPSWGD